VQGKKKQLEKLPWSCMMSFARNETRKVFIFSILLKNPLKWPRFRSWSTYTHNLWPFGVMVEYNNLRFVGGGLFWPKKTKDWGNELARTNEVRQRGMSWFTHSFWLFLPYMHAICYMVYVIWYMAYSPKALAH